ncbi:MAG: pyruvate dehydrogenase complex dihydrolipoamide acetyltransferase [Deltaproteobacteria bacterium]|nr:MAG: pyruvate dehydrogenase complex dihydrolipoamide acetyltransferase [Deltaproteobacteria bacterium]
MPADVRMPSLGFDMTEGKLARWLKQEGDRIERGQAIAEIETEKATVEIEADASGVLAKIIVPAGQTVPVGTVIGIIAEAGEKIAETPTAPAPAAPSTPPPPAAAETGGHAAPPEARVKASPVARKMAEEAGIDLRRIQGTGPDGRIMERDVQAAIGGAPPPQRPAAEAAPAAPAPMSRMRQAIARRMTESKTTAPHFYVTVEINMDEAMRLREQLNRLASDEEKISVNDLVVAASARTLARFPTLNASYRDDRIEMHPRIDIGIAVALEDGLLPPVLHDADKKALRTIAVESKSLAERARTNKLRSDDLGSGTFTVSNLGMFDVDEFIAIINPPEAAILAVGAVTRRPAVVGGEVRIASLMKATLSVDHRVSDGAQAARFMQEFKKLLENPLNLLTYS